MEKLRDVLVTDRSPADVLAQNGRGTYNAEDVNRVLRACSWLAGRLEGYGYSVPGEYFPAVLIHAAARPPHGGIAESALAYKGEAVTVRVTPSSGYAFSHWEEGGAAVSTDEAYCFMANRDRELVAVFDVPDSEESGVVGLAAAGRAIVGKDVE